MMYDLSIDIETFSGVDIKKSGLYKYVESPDFQLLLLAFSMNGVPPAVIDFTEDDGGMLWASIKDMLVNPAIIKHAYNASFEIACLSKVLGFQLPADQWRCTQLQGLYCGYPMGLASIGNALGLDSDKKKQTTGSALIKYFCTPCAATKSNGGRTRNMPKHDPEKWELFRSYCAGDVTAEMEVARRLSLFPVPDDIQRQWVTDLAINQRGAAVDTEFVDGALELDANSRAALTQEAVMLSNLSNPSSVAQLSTWLSEEIDEDLPDLRKSTVAELLKTGVESSKARRMLEIRQELSKTSTKKYDAIKAAVCADKRVRGLLQFYGANRTGRFAGRLVQVQNLPQTHLDMLDDARLHVKRREADKLRLVYGSLPDTLSQLIRTAFVASPGNVLIDADFSAIEARVISWLAGETWRVEVFKTHGKIYEASASQMFGVPIGLIAKGNPEYALRQKGKVAELALGYQGGPGALITMGALKMGLTEEELPEIVQRWRSTNKRIVGLWYGLEKAAVAAINFGTPVGLNGLIVARETDPQNRLDFLTIRLHSGRKLFYANPRLGVNQWGNSSITYSGMNQTTKKWESVETYGGKLVENVVQAIARDCLVEAIDRLEADGYKVVFSVHDEVVIDCPKEGASLERVIQLMSMPMEWAPDLPLGADGWVGEYYRKD